LTPRAGLVRRHPQPQQHAAVRQNSRERDRLRVAAAYKETAPSVYETRDLNAIRTWARELAEM